MTSDKPILVAMFAKTWKKRNDGPNRGDPAMTLLPPEGQYSSHFTWSSVQDPKGKEFDNKVAVIIEKSKMDGLMLDNANVAWEEQKVR